MSDLLNQAAKVLPVLPSVLVVLLAAVAVRLSRRLLGSGPDQPDRGDFRVQLTNLGILLAAAIALVVALPVDAQLRGQLLSLLGIVLSAAIALSSTTFVGNVMAGVMLKAVRNFRSGDFVQVGDQFGRVTVRGLLSTEIQTEDRDLVTLPNLHLVTNPVRVVRSDGTIVTAEVSLGYDAHHEKVEALLLAAAAEAGLNDPFVLVMNLGDFAVTYRVAGLLQNVKHLLSARSRLRVAMLDSLHDGGIEIVSPNFMTTRALAPETHVAPDPAVTEPEVEGATVEEVAFDKADEAATLDQLKEAYRKVKDELDNPPAADADADPDAAERRKAVLEKRLERLKVAIEERRKADEGPA